MSMHRIKLGEADRRHIIAMSGGRCNRCRTKLFLENDFGEIARIGDDAHIVAASENGPRGDSHVDAQQRASFENILLLCKNCHAEVDQQPQEFSVSTLMQLREEHYDWVDECLGEKIVERPPFHYLSYINLPRADMYAAVNSISLPKPNLGDAKCIRDLGIGAGRLMADYVAVLNHDDLYANELKDKTNLTDLGVGEYWYSPVSNFRTKKVPYEYSPIVLEAWKKHECAIYRKFGDWKLVCLIDPRWITTTTAWTMLSSGTLKTVALVNVLKVDTEHGFVLASPIFLGAPDNGTWL